EGVAHVVRREARGQAGRLAQRVQGEDVAVRRVPGRRVRAAVAVEAEVVAAPGDPGTLLAGREHVPLRLYPGQHPVDEGAAWSVGVHARQGELAARPGHAGPSQLRGQVPRRVRVG